MTSHHMWHQRVQDRLVSVWVWNDRWVVSTQAITLSAPCPRNRPTDVSWTLIVYGWAVYGFMCVPGAIGATGSGTRFIHGCSYELSIGCLYMEPKVQVVPREISMEMLCMFLPWRCLRSVVLCMFLHIPNLFGIWTKIHHGNRYFPTIIETGGDSRRSSVS